MKWKLAFIHKRFLCSQKLTMVKISHFENLTIFGSFPSYRLSQQTCVKFWGFLSRWCQPTKLFSYNFSLTFLCIKTYFFFFNLVILFWYPNPTCHFVKINCFLFEFYLALATLKKRVVIRIHEQIFKHDNYSKLNFRISNFFVKF
jgi:hypothetical protein